MSLAAKSPRQQYAAQDLSLQCASLQVAGNTPRGVYLLADEVDPLVLHGVLFPPSSGPFSGGVFRFVIYWPGSTSATAGNANHQAGSTSGASRKVKTAAPSVSSPTVVFHQGLNHPLIHPSTHALSLTPRFSPWRPRTDTLSHLVYYIRDCFGWKLLEDLKPREGWWTNAEMGRLLRTSTKMFSNLASQSAQLSVSPSALYPTAQPEPETVADVMSRGIKFTSTTDDEGKDDLEALRREIFGGSDQP